MRGEEVVDEAGEVVQLGGRDRRRRRPCRGTPARGGRGRRLVRRRRPRRTGWRAGCRRSRRSCRATRRPRRRARPRAARRAARRPAARRAPCSARGAAASPRTVTTVVLARCVDPRLVHRPALQRCCTPADALRGVAPRPRARAGACQASARRSSPTRAAHRLRRGSRNSSSREQALPRREVVAARGRVCTHAHSASASSAVMTAWRSQASSCSRASTIARRLGVRAAAGRRRPRRPRAPRPAREQALDAPRRRSRRRR